MSESSDAHPEELSAEELDEIEKLTGQRSTIKKLRSAIVRGVFVIGALVASGFILVNTFEDLDYEAILDSVRSLEDADFIALIAMWVIWVTCQGLLTGALVKGLPVRRGVIAYLGPAGVTSVLPGPSDLPFRHKMFTTWGYSPSEATLAVAAGGVFSIGIKLVLPLVAAIGLLVSNTPIDGTLRTIVVIAVLVGVGVLGVAYVFGAERRTAWMGRMLTAIWAFVLRLLRKPDPPDLAEKMIDARAESIERLRDRWVIGTWATVITAGARFALLLMAVRFTGTPDSAISWPQVFVVYAVVQGLTVLPITAGDAGVSEVAYIGLLTAAAGSQYVNQITAGVLIFRVLTWVIIIPIGLGTLAVWQRLTARAARAAAAAPADPEHSEQPSR
jgi:putative heme transporter